MSRPPFKITKEVKAVADFVWRRDMGKEKFLVLSGPYGTGKTQIARAVSKLRPIEWGAGVVQHWQDYGLSQLGIRERIYPKGPDIYDPATKTFSAEVIRQGKMALIDDVRDVGKGKWGVDPKEVFDSLVCHVMAEKNAALIITTNLDWGELEKIFDNRALDRLKSNGTWLGKSDKPGEPSYFTRKFRGTPQDSGPDPIRIPAPWLIGQGVEA